jgi:hypothetical protein
MVLPRRTSPQVGVIPADAVRDSFQTEDESKDGEVVRAINRFSITEENSFRCFDFGDHQARLQNKAESISVGPTL